MVGQGEMSQQEATEFAKCSIAAFKRRIRVYRLDQQSYN